MYKIPQATTMQTGRSGTRHFNNTTSTIMEDHYPTDAFDCTPTAEELAELEPQDFDCAAQPEEVVKPEEVKIVNKPVYNGKIYHITDLFWLINPKYGQENETYADGEVNLVTLSFNSDFGNLRVGFFNIPNGAIHNKTIFHNKLQSVISGAIYPSACFRLIHNDIAEDNIVCSEQLITYDANQKWQKERPEVWIQKYAKGIRLNIYDVVAGKNHIYDFTGWQRKCFEHACRFVINEGAILHGQNVLSK